MNRISTLTLLAALVLSLGLSACDSDPNTEEEVPALTSQAVVDLPADPFVGFDPVTQQPVGSGEFTYYSLRAKNIVTEVDANSTDWDLALRGTTILVNGGTSGPGQGQAQVVEGLFEEITVAPDTGWATDGDEGTAIPTGSGNGWYNYNPASMTVTPIPGRVLLIRTADGLCAKLRILSYYKGMPETPTMESEARYYNFEFVLQPDGSRNLQ